jgi:ATP-dependent DNA helicase RecG
VEETRLSVTPALEAQLNKRQRKIMEHVLESGSVTTGWCMKTFRVVRDTAHRDLVNLVELNLLVPKGAGRGAAYVLREGTSASEIIR